MALYDRALPQVYGYLADRCRDPATAEDLTSETFLAAVRADATDATDATGGDDG
jgi:RNA polymerase sigma-70 factor (ECF subfamily)